MKSSLEENIYGHLSRLKWIISHLKRDERTLEFGCGTGYMITLQLLNEGFDAYGVDLDEPSISYGRRLLQDSGHDPVRLINRDISEIEHSYDIVIASEVLEHIPDSEMLAIMRLLAAKTKEDGSLLVTVPNGYGWFELESFLWFKMGIGRLVSATKIDKWIFSFKQLIFGSSGIGEHPSTLASSPHVQRFTYRSIQKLLQSNGFEVESIAGTVLFAGPFSNLLFTGSKAIPRLNLFLGKMFPRISCGFLVKSKLLSK